MNKSQIKINGYLLSILDVSLPSPKFSPLITEFEEKEEHFLKSLISKIYFDTDIKKGTISLQHKYFKLLEKGDTNFIAFSNEISKAVHFFMLNHSVIPSGDGIFIDVSIDEINYFFFLKLNYQKRFLHWLDESDTLHLIENVCILPPSSQKCSEGFFINLSNKRVSVKDSTYTFEEEPIAYLSNYILGIILEKSENEIKKIIDEVTFHTIEKHYEETAPKLICYKNTLAQTAETKGEINTQEIVSTLFQDKKEAEKEYIETLEKNGIHKTEITISKKLEKKLTKKQKITTSNGIEILIPTEYLTKTDLFEYKQEPNGKLTILIKDIEKIENK